MKGYRIKVVAQITINVTKEEFDEDDSVGIGFNKFNAVMYAKGCLVERIRNNPNVGSLKKNRKPFIHAILDEVKNLKT